MPEGALVHQLIGGFVAGIVVLAGWRFFPRRFAAAEDGWRRFSRRRLLVLAVALLLGPGLRLVITPWFPPPDPVYVDEFGHILAADTLLHGRLANPPHPHAPHFAAPHVLHDPKYASKYPLGQGAALAIGRLLGGDYWFGVVFAMLACCGAVTLLLYQYLPAPAAAIGALLFSLRFGLDTYWINSYWGGALAGAAGATALALLPGLLKTGSRASAAALAAAWAVCWFVRPFESVPLGLAIAVLLLYRLYGHWDTELRTRLLQCAAVLFVGVLITLGLTAVHNASVTGSPAKLPFLVYSERAPNSDEFAWGDNSHQPDRFRRTPILGTLTNEYPQIWRFFIGVPLTLPLLVGIRFLLTDRRRRWMVYLFLAALSWSSLYQWCNPHYIAPYAGLFFVLVLAGLDRLSRWKLWEIPAGLVLAAVFVFGAVYPAASLRGTRFMIDSGLHDTARSQLQRELEQAGGKHVVLVRYPKDYWKTYDRWQFNGADIDAGRVIWALDLGASSNRELLDYYSGRQAWLTIPSSHPELKPCPTTGN